MRNEYKHSPFTLRLRYTQVSEDQLTHFFYATSDIFMGHRPNLVSVVKVEEVRGWLARMGQKNSKENRP